MGINPHTPVYVSLFHALCSFGLSFQSTPRPAGHGTNEHTCSLLTWGQTSPEANAVAAAAGRVVAAIGNPAAAGVVGPTAAT